LDPNFSSLRPSTPPLFIGGGSGQSFLHWRTNLALDSVGKDPNRRLKACIVSCSIYRKKLYELACLGRRRRCLVAIQTEMFSLGCKATAGDHLRAHFIRFDGEMKH
jgi:hypothetical protein